MSKQWFIQRKVLCSPEQNLSNTTGSPFCHGFTRSQKNFIQFSSPLEQWLRTRSPQKVFSKQNNFMSNFCFREEMTKGSTHFVFHGEEAVAPDPLERKGLDDRPLLHDEHVKYLQVACKANTAASPHKSWHFSSPWVLGIHRRSRLSHLCTTENLFQWKVFFWADGNFRSSSTP